MRGRQAHQAQQLGAIAQRRRCVLCWRGNVNNQSAYKALMLIFFQYSVSSTKNIEQVHTRQNRAYLWCSQSSSTTGQLRNWSAQVKQLTNNLQMRKEGTLFDTVIMTIDVTVYLSNATSFWSFVSFCS